jgi:hypothetical protein
MGLVSEREEGKEMILRVKRVEVHYMYTYEDSVTLRGRGEGSGSIMEALSELVQGTLYTCIELSQ